MCHEKLFHGEISKQFTKLKIALQIPEVHKSKSAPQRQFFSQETKLALDILYITKKNPKTKKTKPNI